MVTNKTKAFSLAEAILSMMILTLVGLATIPIMTKKAPQVSHTGIRGQYGCWVEGGTVYEQYFDERTARSAPKSGGCTLKLDQRPNRYYILATGAGGSNTHGQTVTTYADAVDSDLHIEVGTGAGQETIIYSDDKDNPIIIASGGETSAVTNGLIAENIRACRILSAPCASSTGAPKSCEVIYTTEEGDDGSTTQVNKIRINGCENEDEFENYDDSNLIELTSLTASGGSSGVNLTNISPASISGYSQSNNMKYSSGGFSMAFDLLDSNFVNSEYLFGMVNNGSHGANTQSKMSKILQEMTPRRKTSLTEKLIELNPGLPNKPGAVIVIW